ncbi:MAG: hypothetical protein QME81_09775 [bacterium]|nr:hypothetical protein [bacterium]
MAQTMTRAVIRNRVSAHGFRVHGSGFTVEESGGFGHPFGVSSSNLMGICCKL